MKRIVCMAAASAALAVLAAASGASAFPSLTGPLPSGEWSEWQYQGRSLTLEGVTGARMKCLTSYVQYRISSPTQIDLNVEGVGCTSGHREPCFSGVHEVGNAGFSVTGTLGYIDKARRKVGLVLTGAGEPEVPEALMRLFCFSAFGAGGWDEGDEIYPSGSVVAAVSPVDHVTESLRLTSKQHHGVPTLAGLETGPASLSMYEPASELSEPIGLGLVATLKLPGSIEVSG